MGNPASSVGVVTLWMPKENVAEYLNKDHYAVCGQLYTKGGINFIIRNILANPKICHLVMCGFDRQDSGGALLKFFKNGVTAIKDSSGEIINWQIKGDTKAFIDPQIPLTYLEKIREKVVLHDLRENSLEEVAAKVSDLHRTSVGRKGFCDPINFPDSQKSAVDTFPSDHSVFKIRREYVGDAWVDALKTVTRFGRKTLGMYGEVGQVANLSIVIEKEDPNDPQLYDFFNFDKKQLELYYEGFFSKNEVNSEVYTYGQRIFDFNGIDQEEIMIKKLTQFEYDRGAIAVLWDAKKDNFPPKGVKIIQKGQTGKWRVPCLVMILGQVVENTFDMTAVFRNNDIYGAWPLNAFALRLFQKKIAEKIGKGLGTLTTISHIAEIYELNWNDAKKTVENNDDLSRTCQYDPRGYYIVKRENNDIVLTFYSPDGSRELATLKMDGTKPKAARDLSALALKDMLVSDLGAACDLGRQLAKAETAIKLGLQFEQDQPLRA